MTKQEAAQAYLRRDPVLYANLLEALRRGSAELLEAGEGGVLLYERGCGAYMMSAASPAVAGRLLGMVSADCDLFVGHELAYFEQAKARWGFPLSQICYSAAYLGTEPLPLPAFDGALRPLDRTWAPWILRHYSHAFGGLPYMEEAVRRGVLGAFPTGSNHPAGFVGFHEEGSIGMLEVLPAWRRRGLGELLLRAAVNRALERGALPFAQVIEDNAPSLALQQKAGLTLSGTRMFWLMRE